MKIVKLFSFFFIFKTFEQKPEFKIIIHFDGEADQPDHNENNKLTIQKPEQKLIAHRNAEIFGNIKMIKNSDPNNNS